MRGKATAATALLLGMLALPLAPTSAQATSCAAIRSTAAELLRGAPLHEQLPDRLFDTYDYALVGTVTAVRPVGPEQAVDIDVAAAFHRAATPKRLTVRMQDRGELMGYPFDVGRAYFVAVKDDRVGLCSPTMPLDSVDPSADRAIGVLRGAARDGGVAVAVPSGATTPADEAGTPPAPAPARGAEAGAPKALAAGGSLVVLGGLTAAVVAVRSRRRRGTTGADTPR